MSNSNENDINKTTLFENINDFDDFRNQFQQAIDVAAQNLGANIDIDNFLKTSGSTFESNGWQFKINNIQLAQSNANTNSAQNLLSENRDNVNQNILNEITSGLNKQKQNKAACTKLFFDNLEAFELKIDSAEILWLLKELEPGREGREQGMIDRYTNKLTEIFGRYIKKLIHRSEILQLKEQEQKLFKDSLQALASCAVKIIFSKRYPVGYPANFEAFKTNFQQLEKMVTQKMLSINSASTKESIDRVKSESEVVNDVFVILIDGIIALNRESDQINAPQKRFLNWLRRSLMKNLRGLSLEIKLEIIKFLSRENSNSNSKKKFDYLDYESWDWETFADLDFIFKLTIDKFDYSSLKIPDDLKSVESLTSQQGVPEPLNCVMCPFVLIDIYKEEFVRGILRELLQKLKFPDYVSLIKNCHSSFLRLCFKKYKQNDTDELRDDIKSVLQALLAQYRAKTKINSIIADLWEVKFKAQINYFLDKKYGLCQLVPGLSDEIKQGIAEDIKKLFTEVKVAFLSDIQPGTAFEAFKILSQQNEDDKLKELVGDDNIFNLFLEYVEQNAKNDRSDEHTNKHRNEHVDEDLAQFNSLIAEIKNKSTSGKLSVDDKSSIVRFFVNKDFDYVNNLAQITNKLKKLTLKNDISDDNISSKENSAEKDVDSTKDDLKLNEQAKNESSNHLPNTKEEKEKAKAITQQKQENQESDQEKKENYVETSKGNGSSINDEHEKSNGVHQKNTILSEEKEGNEENNAKKDIDSIKNDLEINEQMKNVVQNKDDKNNSSAINHSIGNELSNKLPNTKEEKEAAKVPTQQKQEFKLEINLSNNKTIILSPGSCKTAMAELRGCSDFCYLICLIKETIEQQKNPQALECWKQLCDEIKWWESIKVSLYSWFAFWIAKRWRGNMNIGIKLTMPIQSGTNLSKGNREKDKFPNSKDKEKTFSDMNQQRLSKIMDEKNEI